MEKMIGVINDNLKTVISGIKIDKPNSFITACTVSTQVITQVASSQYGGSTITLSHLAPFVEVTRKNLKSIFGGKVNDDLIEFMVKREVAAGVQTIQYQLITMSTTNGQSPFVSVFMYLNEIEDKKDQFNKDKDKNKDLSGNKEQDILDSILTFVFFNLLHIVVMYYLFKYSKK